MNKSNIRMDFFKDLNKAANKAIDKGLCGHEIDNALFQLSISQALSYMSSSELKKHFNYYLKKEINEKENKNNTGSSRKTNRKTNKKRSK